MGRQSCEQSPLFKLQGLVPAAAERSGGSVAAGGHPQGCGRLGRGWGSRGQHHLGQTHGMCVLWASRQGPGLGQQEGTGSAGRPVTVGQTVAPLAARWSGRAAVWPCRVSAPGPHTHLAGCSHCTPSCASPAWCCCAALSPLSHPSCCRCPSSQRPGQPTTACRLEGEGRNMQQPSPSPPALAAEQWLHTDLHAMARKKGSELSLWWRSIPSIAARGHNEQSVFGQGRRKGKGFINHPHHPASSHP